VQFARRTLARLRALKDAATTPPPGSDSFRQALSERTRWALVTPGLVAAQLVAFVLALNEPGPLSSPDSLIGWGASFGPRTTNGEWWRLVTALFVHTSVVHVGASIAGLLQTGLLAERLVGRSAFLVVYGASGLLSGLWALSARTVEVHAGADGAVFGIHGLLLASVAWGLVHRSPLTVPLVVLKRLAPGAVAFVAYHSVAEGLFSQSMQAGLVVGFVAGMALLAGRVASPRPAAGRVLVTLATSSMMVLLVAVPLRGIADVTGAVARVIDIEVRTARVYDEHVTRFRKGRLHVDVLVQLAEQNAGELQSAEHLTLLNKVPRAQAPMLRYASEYLHLRQESWRLRAEGLREGRMQTLRKADAVEQTALRALHRARTGDG
jgi:membrane associated rhomboid family serine protease